MKYLVVTELEDFTDSSKRMKQVIAVFNNIGSAELFKKIFKNALNKEVEIIYIIESLMRSHEY